MSSSPIRVQLPGGDIYAPALRQAASKTAARSGLSKRRSNAFEALVAAAVDELNSGDATMITLEMHVHEDSLEASVAGTGCSAPTKKLVKATDKLGDSKARHFERNASKAETVIRFEL